MDNEIVRFSKEEFSYEALFAFKHYRIEDWSAVEQIQVLKDLFEKKIAFNNNVQDAHRIEIAEYIALYEEFVKYPHMLVKNLNGKITVH